MGGFVDAISNVGKDVVENIASKFDKTEVSQLWSRLRPMEKEFQKSEAGKDLLELNKQYIQNYQKSLQSGIDFASKLPKHQQPHPLQIAHQARNIARAATYGENDALGAFLIHQAGKTSGMDSAAAHLHQQNLADFTSSILHDYETRPTWRSLTEQERNAVDMENFERIKSEKDLIKKKTTIAGKSAPFSSFKTNVSQNKQYPTYLDLKATYAPTGNLEHNFQQYAQRVVYPLVVLPHLGTIMNNAISTPLSDLGKAAIENIKLGQGSTEYAKVMDFAHKAGVFASTAYDVYSSDYYGSRGLTSKYFGDKVGQIVYKGTHNPLFDPARKWQLAFSASAGYHTALDMTERLMKNPKDRRAIYELTQMGIDPAKVIAQKGELSDDQIQKAVWRFVDNKVFLDSSLQRAFISRTHPILRTMLMYHSYVTRQARLMMEEVFKKPLATGDLAGIAQTIAALGVAFPLVGMMTKNVTTLARGDWSDVHPQNDIDDLMGKNGAKAFALQMLEDYSHVASFGIATSYLRGASRHSAANMMVGPLGNIAGRVLEDSIHPIANGIQKGFTREGAFEDYKPILRDAIQDNPFAVDNLGKVASHYLLPTKREEAALHPKPTMRFKSKVKKPHFKKF